MANFKLGLTNKSALRQSLFWCLLWSCVLFMVSGFDFSQPLMLKRLLIIGTGLVLLVHTNVLLLLPRLYFTKRYAYYIFAILVLLVAMSRVMPLIEHGLLGQEAATLGGQPLRPGRPGGARGFIFLVPFVVTAIGSTLYEIALFAAGKEREASLLKSEKLEAEIKFLKSQINPHFLFNALNNIYTQTLIKSDEAPENLLKLSTMLRYVLYDCAADKVPLRKELAYIRHYIDLFRLKDSSGIDIRVSLDESRPELRIAPLIFIPFIENAFKHSGLENIGQGWVSIQLRTNEQQLDFEVKNSLPASAQNKDAVGGIGLENVRRQLVLMYPDQHQLEIHTSENTFEVHLRINSF